MGGGLPGGTLVTSLGLSVGSVIYRRLWLYRFDPDRGWRFIELIEVGDLLSYHLAEGPLEVSLAL